MGLKPRQLWAKYDEDKGFLKADGMTAAAAQVQFGK